MLLNPIALDYSRLTFDSCIRRPRRMSVACVVPEGASPPPEPPPKDYVIESDSVFNTLDSGIVPLQKRDGKLRARLEACKQGMLQLDALRSKHHRLMQEMRGRLSPIPGCAVVQARIKRITEPQDRCSLQSVDSAISTNTMSTPSRSSSPSISHRSSVSCDSGCSSVFSQNDHNGNQPTIPYSTYRKLSVEERGLPAANRLSKDLHQSPLDPAARSSLPIVATTIASTTEGVEKHWRRKQTVPRPRSMYERGSDKKDFERESMLDSASFSQITPPPVHRKLGIVQPPPSILQTPRSPLTPVRFACNASPQSPQRPLRTAQKPVDLVVKAKTARIQSPDAVFHASCIFVDRSPPSPPRHAAIRPRSLFVQSEDEPLYATPARVLVRDRTVPVFAQSSPRRTAFSPVVSRVVSTYSGIQEKPRSSGRILGRQWRESEGL